MARVGVGAFVHDQQAASISSQLVFHALNAHRQRHGLPTVPWSPSLSTVAQLHAEDVLANFHGPPGKDYPLVFPPGCNGHSWSGQGVGSRVDYYEDHRNGKGMWDKPRELTRYRGNGYEISLYGYNSRYNVRRQRYITSMEAAAEVVRGWESSPGHNNCVLEKDIWTAQRWQAMGVGWASRGSVFYACAWFGTERDVA